MKKLLTWAYRAILFIFGFSAFLFICNESIENHWGIFILKLGAAAIIWGVVKLFAKTLTEEERNQDK